MQRTHIFRSSSSEKLNDSSSRVFIENIHQIDEHVLPLNVPILKTQTHSTTYTQTIQGVPLSFSSKSIPSFAETQLLSVYYPSNKISSNNNDECVHFEQQNREPIRYRLSYDPISSTKSTQTPPIPTPLSTHSSTLIIHGNDKRDSNHIKRVKIHSGNQNLSDDINKHPTSSNELIEESHHTYEEYIVNIDENKNQSSSSSSSSSNASVNTVIARNSDNHQTHVSSNNERISSWPPVPDDAININIQYENDGEKQSSKLQVLDRSNRIIPILTTNNPIEKPNLTSNNTAQTLNQSKWIQTHIDKSDITINATPSRVNTLRSLFEQQNVPSVSTNSTNRMEADGNLAKYGDEIRFHTKESTIHYAQPVQIIQSETKLSPTNVKDDQSSRLDQIREITGKPLKYLNDAGHYLQDGHTWQWNEVFWLSLTNSQRDQLRILEYELNKQPTIKPPPSPNETKRYKSIINITGAGSWQQQQQQSSSGLTKYSEAHSVNETHPSISVLSSTHSKVDTQYITTPIEKSTSMLNKQIQLDPLSYEQFIYDYISTYGKHLRSTDNRLTLSIDNQEINLSSSYNYPTSAKNFYSDTIDKDVLPFETESNQLVIFLHSEPIQLSVDRWSFYKNKYQNAQWIRELKRVNRNIPIKLIPIVSEWLENHSTISFDTNIINVDGSTIPIKGRLGLKLCKSQQTNINYWEDVLNYLTSLGYVSYDANEKLVLIAYTELDARRILTAHSTELIERIARYLRTLNDIHVENGALALTENFILPKEYVSDLLIKYQQDKNLDANELASLLLDICHTYEDDTDKRIVLTLNKQVLEIINYENHMDILIQWLNTLNQQKSIEITDENDIFIHAKNQNKQDQKIFIKHDHIHAYMRTKQSNTQTKIVDIEDIANILFTYNYVQYSSGQLIFPMQNIILNTNELRWLQSIIHSIQPDEHVQETKIELFDGHNTQILQIPFEYMSPTNDREIVANYLFQNGLVRYDVNTGTYMYRYISSNENTYSTDDYTSQHQLLSSHIQHIHVDETNQSIELEFIHEPIQYLLLPSQWYQQILEHEFNRSYIIDLLLKNGGKFHNDTFIFNNYTYSLKSSNTEIVDLSLKEKEILINHYVEYINSQGEIKHDKSKHILILENLSDGSKLYLTVEHTEFLEKNQFRREDMNSLLMKHSQIKQDQFQNWFLYYNNQCVQIPLLTESIDQEELYDNYHKIIDYMYNHNLIIFNKNLQYIQIHFSNEILTIPINQLQSIINYKINHVLPFTSFQLSQWLLNHINQIDYLNNEYIRILYKNKFYHLSLNYSTDEENCRNSKLKLIFPYNQSLRLIQKTSSTTTLDIEQPSIENNYTIDPLLILANYIHRAGTVYQDYIGRLIIKLGHHEIVVPRIDAFNAIEAINTSPQRTGTIITRLIHRIGNVNTNQAGGLLITIGKSSFEITKEAIDRSNKIFNENNSQLTPTVHRQTTKSPVLPLLRHSKSASSLLSSSIDEQLSFTDDQQILYAKDGRGDARYLNSDQLNNRKQRKTKLCMLIIPDDETVRFYIQQLDGNVVGSNNSLNSLRSQYSSNRSGKPQLISPQTYQNSALREALVYVHKQDGNKVYYENLAQYLSREQTYLSSRTIRRMLKFTSADEYFNYLSKKLSANHAEQLVQQSEQSFSNYRNSQENLYHVKSSRSPQSTNGTGGQSLLTSDKNITLPRSTTLSGQSNDAENESRVTVSRSASAAAKVVTSKSDTIKSTTSSSGPSSREISPNRTSGSKGAEDEVKKEKKSKFRTPSFLRRRKEKKEAANKDKMDK